MSELREILSKGGRLGQLKVFHNYGTRTEAERKEGEFMVSVDNLVTTNSAKFSLKEYRFVLYQQINYLKSQGLWDGNE